MLGQCHPGATLAPSGTNVEPVNGSILFRGARCRAVRLSATAGTKQKAVSAASSAPQIPRRRFKSCSAIVTTDEARNKNLFAGDFGLRVF